MQHTLNIKLIHISLTLRHLDQSKWQSCISIRWPDNLINYRTTASHLLSSQITLAMEPLPDSHLFHLAAHSMDELDKSKLVHWDKDPPYSQSKLANTPEEEQFTRSLMDVMFGRWVCLEIEARTHCKRRYILCRWKATAHPRPPSDCCQGVCSMGATQWPFHHMQSTEA